MDTELRELIDAIKVQAEAISRLAESNMMLVAALADMEGEDSEVLGRYMDGTPISG